MHHQVEKYQERSPRVQINTASQNKALVIQNFLDNRSADVLEKGVRLPSSTIQLRPLNVAELKNLEVAKKEFEDLKIRKSALADALRKRGGFGNYLGYFQDRGWAHATEEIKMLDTNFEEMNDLSRRAITNSKVCKTFISKVNFFTKSGGMNRFNNIFSSAEKGLLSKERNDPTQFTKMDEIHFRDYMAKSKPAITVLRGDGRDVTPDSFKDLPFTNIPAGGTSDISFAGVVEHTHTNTLKNGMVSCTTDFDTALHFATEKHEYGVVWELELDKYIHVADLLKTRNFKNRFPQQFEVLHPGSIPKSKIKSATLYKKNVPVEKRTS
ncbi:hypothetical protein [Rubritalea marina]|uniref:hypothetical protein n=1 Tax=Rubritalea marina TaxID=361055 RepID=UPI00036BE171|nr:hypothetical protein [Rubritalea marina]